jgi:outer membrane protein OmpA-like peptidoglycan-associated protein
VRDQLVRDGVAALRLSAIGRGEYEPRADNATPAGRAQNRRVEILLQSNA